MRPENAEILKHLWGKSEKGREGDGGRWGERMRRVCY